MKEAIDMEDWHERQIQILMESGTPQAADVVFQLGRGAQTALPLADLLTPQQNLARVRRLNPYAQGSMIHPATSFATEFSHRQRPLA